MINKKILDDYLITGWPNHFFSQKAVKKYNTLITKFAKKSRGKDDLTVLQKICGIVYTNTYLNLYDIIEYRKEQSKEERKNAQTII